MFSEKLERLIQASLQDGMLTEQEKAAIIRRAQAEGEDVDEVDIYIQSLQQKKQKELKKTENARETQHQKEKEEKFGKVCPNCGKQVPPLTLVCDCGYEFQKGASVSSVKALSDKIDSINAEPLSEYDNVREGEIEQRDERIMSLINTFPVPNSKEDIMEFLALAAPNAKKRGGLFGTVAGRFLVLIPVLIIVAILISFFVAIVSYDGESVLLSFFLCLVVGSFLIIFAATGLDKSTLRFNKFTKVWRTKFDQVLMKGRSLRGDAEFTQMLDYYENLVGK